MTLTLTLEFADNNPQEGVLRSDVTPPHRHDDRVRNPTEPMCVWFFILFFLFFYERRADAEGPPSKIVIPVECVCPVCARLRIFTARLSRVSFLLCKKPGQHATARAGAGARTSLSEGRAWKRRTHRMSKPHAVLIAPTRCALFSLHTVDAAAREPTADNQ